MPKLEIDEADLAAYQQLAALMGTMMANPEARKQVLRAKKIVKPDEAIPELDSAQPLVDAQAEMTKQLEVFRQELADEKAAREQAKQLEKFQSEFQAQRAALMAEGYTAEGLDKIVEHAKEHGIGNLQVAAAHWEKTNPQPAPVDPQGAFGSWNFFDPGAEQEQDNYVKKLLDTQGQSEAIADAEARKVLAEIRGQGGRRAAR